MFFKIILHVVSSVFTAKLINSLNHDIRAPMGVTDTFYVLRTSFTFKI